MLVLLSSVLGPFPASLHVILTTAQLPLEAGNAVTRTLQMRFREGKGVNKRQSCLSSDLLSTTKIVLLGAQHDDSSDQGGWGQSSISSAPPRADHVQKGSQQEEARSTPSSAPRKQHAHGLLCTVPGCPTHGGFLQRFMAFLSCRSKVKVTQWV